MGPGLLRTHTDLASLLPRGETAAEAPSAVLPSSLSVQGRESSEGMSRGPAPADWGGKLRCYPATQLMPSQSNLPNKSGPRPSRSFADLRQYLSIRILCPVNVLLDHKVTVNLCCTY